MYTAVITLVAEGAAVFSNATIKGATDSSVSQDGKTLTASITYPATEKITGYYWDFDGSDYTYVTGNGFGVNELSPNATVSGTLDMARPVTLKNNQEWTIEWKGGFSSAKLENVHLVPLAFNNATDQKNPKPGAFIYVCSGFDKVENTNKICVIEAGYATHDKSMFKSAIVDNATLTDPNTVWNISYNGKGNMTITVTLEDKVQTFAQEVVFKELTFNGIKGFLWTSQPACVDNTMDYMKITMGKRYISIGDINADEKINILDVQKLFGYVNGRIPLSNEVLESSDTNYDGKINVLDVNRLFRVVNQTAGKILTVGPNGMYSTVKSAVKAAQAGDTVLIDRGVYHETVSNYDKDITIMGVDRDEVIIEYENGDYGHPPLNMGVGVVKNLTLHAISSEMTHAWSKAYCIHTDFHSSLNGKVGGRLLVENVRMINDDWIPFGIGLRSNFTLEIRDCEMICSSENPAFYCHPAANSYDIGQRLIVKNCVMQNNSATVETVRMQTYEQGEGVASCTWYGNTVTNIGGGPTFMMLISRHNGLSESNWHGSSDWVITEDSEKNNIPELNY